MKSIALHTMLDIADSGDCLLWQGSGAIARLIRLWTDYSHASLLVRLKDCDGKLYLVEAVASGVEFRDARQRIVEADGDVFLFRPKWMTPESRQCIVRRAMDIVAQGVRYDFRSLLANALGRVSTDAHRYFCSELVWDVWVNCGIASAWALTAPRPGDIPRRLAGYLCQIKKEDGDEARI